MGLPVEVNNLMLGSLGGYTVGRSLRFRSSATAYLNRTPASAGNQQKWTWSGWVKRGALSYVHPFLFSCYQDDNNRTVIGWYNSDQFAVYNIDAASVNLNLVTTAVYRDPSAWYHIVVAIDTTQATSSNRAIIYINGQQVTALSTATYPSQNTSLYMNSARQHRIASSPESSPKYFDGYLAEVNFIDGQQLTPSSFGAYDTNGVWQPKKYTGTYGTNGFYLPFTSGYNTTQSFAGSFNGSSFASVAANAAFAPGTGDFTVEANINVTSLPGTGVAYGVFENQVATTAATSDKFWFGLLNSGGTRYLFMGQHNTANGASTLWTPTVGTWYHIALVRTSGTIKMFINGVEQTVSSSISSGSSFSQNGVSFGAASNTGSPSYFNGYISNARYVVGTAVYTTGFTPPSANLTAVTNTQLLTLQNATLVDNSASARTITNNGSVSISGAYPFQYTLASFGSDYSGNNNSWTLNNINVTALSTTYDSMIDSPTNAAGTSTGIGNYAVLNAVKLNDPATGFAAELSQGNLAIINTRSSGQPENAVSTIGVTSGKWYYEATMGGNPSPGLQWIGINTSDYGSGSYVRGYRNDNGQYYNGSAWSAYGASYVSGDVIGVAFDLDGQTIEFFKNGTSQGQKTSIGVSGQVMFAATVITQGSGAFYFNFGQRPFAYTPPSGFKALNTYNLPAPSIANGAQYMAATLWTGDGTNGRSITNTNNGFSFAPDLVWVKSRSNAYYNMFQDTVRGAGKSIFSNVADAESGNSGDLIGAFQSNGFTVNLNYTSQTTNPTTNGSAATYVAWQWKGGGTAVTNNSGTITSQVSANPSAGCSIITYTGTGATGSAGHGLGVTPAMVIYKSRSAVSPNSSWIVWHKATSQAIHNSSTIGISGFTGAYVLNLTNSVLTYGFDEQMGQSGKNYVAYCFAEVAGFSKFGIYTGNGSADGPFIYTGFRPRWIMWKASSIAGQWFIHDTARSTYNYSDLELAAETSAAEYSANGAGAGQRMDILSNGFKVRTANNANNQSGATYIYAAFAENPFNSSRAR